MQVDIFGGGEEMVLYLQQINVRDDVNESYKTKLNQTMKILYPLPSPLIL